MDGQQARQRARERVEARHGFKVHLAVYLVVCTGLAILNFSTAPNNLWFVWPLFGWGLGLAGHALSVFTGFGRFEVTPEMIDREMAK